MAPFDKEFFGEFIDDGRLDLAPHNLFDLVGKLDGLAPGFADIAPARVHFAVAGVLETDWTHQLAKARETIMLARVGGGGTDSRQERKCGWEGKGVAVADATGGTWTIHKTTKHMIK